MDRKALHKYDVTSDSADLITATLGCLPPFERSLVSDHFFDGASVWTLARRYRVKRRIIEVQLEGALARMVRPWPVVVSGAWLT